MISIGPLLAIAIDAAAAVVRSPGRSSPRLQKSHIEQSIAFTCCLLFSLPAMAEPWQAIPDRPDTQYLVDSAHRIGDHVYMVHRASPPDAFSKYTAAVEFDCGKHAMRTSWADLSYGRMNTRFYSNSARGYTPVQFSEVDAAPQNESFYRWACSLPLPKERLVNARRRDDDTLIQIDVSSVKRIGESVFVWTRYDYPEINLDPPYDAPFDSKREFVKVNCAASSYRILLGYDFTPEGAMTDGMTEPSDEDLPFTADDDYVLAIKDVACDSSLDAIKFAGIGGSSIRPKTPLPRDQNFDDVANPPAVIAAAAKLQSILPQGPTAVVAKIAVEIQNSKHQSDSSVVFFIKPRQDGTIRVQEIYSPTFTVDRERLGPVQLKSKMNSSLSGDRDVTITQSLTVEAPTWAPDAGIVFQTEMLTGSKSTKSDTSCRLGQAVEAETVHTSLKGRAWPLNCHYENGNTSNGFYIEELRYYLVTHNESEFGISDYVIKGIEVER
ncbi:surface-adhesin E family protein (plasmid) [Rhizobium leguminosarum]